MHRTKKFLPSRLTAVWVTGVCALALLAGVSPSAQAATQPSTVTITAHATTPSGSPRSSAASLITCIVKANNPHDSHHVGGTVNFVGTVTCTAPVSSIVMTLTLYWDGYLQADGGAANDGQASLSSNVAAPCTSGGWQGSIVATVVFPPGYVPSGLTGSASNIQSITC